MTRIGDIVQRVRSKNAGPFWLTIDIFCGDATTFEQVRASVSTERVADLFRQPVSALKRFEIGSINVVKFSMPRPVIQGSRGDRDMHGSQWGWLVSELEI